MPSFLSARRWALPGGLAALAALVVAACAPAGHAAGLALLAFLMVLASIGWGRLLGRACGVALPVEIELLLGFCVAAHALALPVMALGWPIAALGAALALGALGCAAPPREERGGGLLILGLLLVAGFALIWALETAGRAASFPAGGPYRLWMDGFIHAGVIAEFGDPRGIGARNSALAGVPTPLYHAVSHAVAGLAVRATGLAPLDSLGAFWMPFGIWLTAMGVLALGRALAGAAGGALAVALLALLPDAAAYGLRHGFLSFHWMMETSPGGLYGLPVALGTLALLRLWLEERRLGLLLLSALMLAGVFLLRAHIFVWMLPPWATVVWLALPWPARRWRWALLGLGAVLAVPALLWIARAEVQAVGLTGFLTRYLHHLHLGYPPTGYDGLYLALTARFGVLGVLPAGLALALAGMGGAWLLAFLIGAGLVAWRGRWRAFDAFPFLLMGWAMMLMLLAPTPFHGDFTDFRQRGFVLVYALLVIWTAAFALRLAPGLGRALPLGALGLAGLLSATLWMPGAKLPRMAGMAALSEVTPRPGLREAAAWMRAAGSRGESFLLAAQKPEEVWFDDATLLLGASGVPAWLSRPGLMRRRGGEVARTAEARLGLAADIHAEPDRAAALARLAREGVGFYLAPVSDPPAWAPGGAGADHAAGELLGWRVPGAGR
jgi:hypothetical protein